MFELLWGGMPLRSRSGDMKKKAIGSILCFVFIVVAVFGTLCIVDHNRMACNEPVLFSTWGKKYAPPEVDIK